MEQTQGVRRRILLAALALTAVLAFPGPARAGFPDKPISIIIAFPPGGTSTNSTKPIADFMSRKLGVPVTLEYKPGAGGNVAALAAIRAPADGSTLVFGHAGPLAINHHINKESFFDPANDLVPVNLTLAYPIMLTVQPNAPVTSAKEFVAHAKGLKEPLVFGSSGNGSIQHLSGELFRRKSGLDFIHVPLAGGGPVQKAFLNGDLGVIFETGSNVVANYKAGTMKPLAVMAPQRLPVMPGIPTMDEAGYDGLYSEAWFGFLAPKGTPPAVIKKLSAVIAEALRQPEINEALVGLGARVINGGPDAFAAHIAAENKRLGPLVRSMGIKPD